MIPSSVTVREGSSVRVRIVSEFPLPLGATCGPSDPRIATGSASIPQGGSQTELAILGRSVGSTPVACILPNFGGAHGIRVAGAVAVSELPCPPQILSQTTTLTVAQNEETSLRVVAEGKAPLSYQWFLGRPGDTSGPIASEEHRTFSPSTRLAGEWEYWVRVMSSCGVINSDAMRVIVQECSLPMILLQPKSQNVRAGQRVLVWVSVSSTSPLTYQWYLGDPGDKSRPIADGQSQTLEIEALPGAMKVWVQVSSPCGAVRSEAVTIWGTTRSRVRRPGIHPATLPSPGATSICPACGNGG